MKQITVILLLSLGCVLALNNGLARTPSMALSTWSVFKSNINDTLVRDLADSLVSLGLVEAGYDYLLVDAGWAGPGCSTCLPNRNEQGELVVDTAKFPLGIKSTIDYVHSKGLKFGLWFGVEMCAETDDYMHHEIRDSSSSYKKYASLDANFFASMGVDAIKHDSCGKFVANTSEAIKVNYQKYADLSAAINATGRPMLYDVTLQLDKPRTVPSYDYNYIWSPEPYGKENVKNIANAWWSVPVNKYNCWKCCVHPNEFIVPDDDKCNSLKYLPSWRGLLPMLDTQDLGVSGFSKEGHWDWGGPGGWNHLDQLSVCVGESWYGPGLTPIEQQSQFSLWAVLASPMIISVDVRNMSPKCYNLVTNSRAIAVHQDPLGRPGRRLKNIYAEVLGDASTTNNGDKKNITAATKTPRAVLEAQIWGRPLIGESVAVIFFNRAAATRNITVSFAELGLSPLIKTVQAVDVWTGRVKNNATSPFTAINVESHGVTFMTFSPMLEATPAKS